MIQINDKLILVEHLGEKVSLDLSDYCPVLEKCFKKAGFHDPFLIDDILLAVSLFAKSKTIEKSGLDELMHRILIDNGLVDVAAHFKLESSLNHQSLRQRISLKVEELMGDLDDVLVDLIEVRVQQAGYQDCDLSDSFLNALCLEEYRLSRIEGTKYQLGAGMLIPNQSFRDMLNLSMARINWDLAELKIEAGGYLFKSVHLNFDLDKIAENLKMPPFVDIVFMNKLEELCDLSFSYLDQALEEFLAVGGEYDYLSIKCKSLTVFEFNTRQKKNFKQEIEKILRKKFSSLSQKGQVLFHIA